MKKILVVFAGLFGLQLSPWAHADLCSDLRAVHAQSRSHFDGWKKEGGGSGKPYAATFVLDRADSCSIAADSGSYSCTWRLASPADLGRAYQRMVDDITACAPLGTQAPAIVRDEPAEREQGKLRQSMAVTGFDFADIEATVLVGRMQVSGAAPEVSRNELKLTFSASPAH